MVKTKGGPWNAAKVGEGETFFGELPGVWFVKVEKPEESILGLFGKALGFKNGRLSVYMWLTRFYSYKSISTA